MALTASQRSAQARWKASQTAARRGQAKDVAAAKAAVKPGTAVAPRAGSAPVSSTTKVTATPKVAAVVPTYSTDTMFQALPQDSPETIGNLGYAGAQYNALMAQRTAGRTRTAEQMGLKFVDDPANGRQFQLDYETNPYSQAALLRRQWTQQKDATRGQAAQSGLGYSGAAQQAFNNDQFNEGSDIYTFGNNAQNALDEIDSSTNTGIGEIVQRIMGWRQDDRDTAAAAAAKTAEEAAKPGAAAPAAATVHKGAGWTSAKKWSPANPVPVKYMTAADKKAYNAWLKRNANQDAARLRGTI